MSTISIIVPVYKVEKYIHRCVDSILAQTFTDFELILVDDGSPDRCPQICDEYAEKDNRIRVIHQENLGQAVARNRAVAVSQGDWICFVDSDDVIHPQMLEHLYGGAMEHGTNISMCGAVEAEQMPEVFSETRERTFQCLTMDEAGEENLYHTGEHRYWVVWGKLIRKDIIVKLPFAPGRIYEDNAIVCRWLHEAGKVSNTLHRYYFYQVNMSGTTKSELNPKKLDYLWALKEQIYFYKKLKWRKIYTKILSAYLSTAVAYYWQFLGSKFDNSYAEKVKKDIRHLYQKNWRLLKLDRWQRLSVYKVAFPVIYYFCELFVATKKIYRSDGAMGIVKKILQSRGKQIK